MNCTWNYNINSIHPIAFDVVLMTLDYGSRDLHIIEKWRNYNFGTETVSGAVTGEVV